MAAGKTGQTTAEQKVVARDPNEEVIFKLIMSGTRVQMFRTETNTKQKIPVHNAVTMNISSIVQFVDESGESVRLRYISAVQEIDYYKQIDRAGKYKVSENYKLNRLDRRDLKFYNGYLVTKKSHLIEFLRRTPENALFKGIDNGGVQVFFEEFSPVESRKKDISLGFRQAEAIVALKGMKDTNQSDRLDSKLLRMYGVHLTLPTDMDEKISLAIDKVNESADNTSALDIILDTADENDSITVTIGKAISEKVISFIQKPDKIMINRAGSKNPVWDELQSISTEHTEQEKVQLFIDIMSTENGKSTLDAIISYLKTS